MPDDNLALPRDFRDFVRLLQAHGVEFVLVGAYAVGAHGRVRATGDIDFLYRASAGNVQRLCDAMRAFGAPAHLIDPEFLQSGGSVTQIGNAPRRIDLLESISGVTFDAVWSRAIQSGIDGETMPVISFEDLLVNKRSTGRKKDIQDAKFLSSRRKR